jgi:formamidopyrimidine-DNA glycosylase
MPEGPELRHSRDRLRSFCGLAVSSFRCGASGRYAKSPPEGHPWIRQERGIIKSIDVHGKFMWWTVNFFETLGDWFLFVHYGMSGQWASQESKHTAYAMDVHGPNPGVLAFNDPRHFGNIKWTDDPDVLKKKLASLGPDMLGDPPDVQAFTASMMRKKKKTLAEALMDQSVTSGVGNYIKAESLYLACLSPHRIVGSLSSDEMSALRLAVINVMQMSYTSGGATIATYRSPDGKSGEAQRRFNVYSHSKTPSGDVVVSETTLDGRTTWWCPAVQK